MLYRTNNRITLERSFSNCVYLKHALDKYGHQNFKIEQLAEANNLDELNQLEIKYIIEYNSLVPNGYNLKEGGNCGGKHNQETKDKISQKLKLYDSCKLAAEDNNVTSASVSMVCNNKCKQIKGFIYKHA